MKGFTRLFPQTVSLLGGFTLYKNRFFLRSQFRNSYPSGHTRPNAKPKMSRDRGNTITVSCADAIKETDAPVPVATSRYNYITKREYLSNVFARKNHTFFMIIFKDNDRECLRESFKLAKFLN